MIAWRRALALTVLLLAGLLGPASAAARCCRDAVVKRCCCPRDLAPDGADRLNRGCCQPPSVQTAGPVQPFDTTPATGLLVALPLEAVDATPPAVRIATPTRLTARARAPDRPLWLTTRSLRC